MNKTYDRRVLLLSLCAVSALSVLSGCEGSGKTSARLVLPNMKYVADAALRDVGEVRRGMPEGAKELTKLFEDAAPEKPAPDTTRDEIARLRRQNHDISSAKSTFFLVAAADGTILRNNLDTDDMAGKNLFSVYPKAKEALKKDYTEFTGSWDVARGVNGRPDAQWMSAARIMSKGEPVGLFVAGWSWSSYAYRLEMALRSEILGNTKSGDKVPLVYVYVVAGGQAYGAPVSPEVNGQAILDQHPLEKTKGTEVWSGPVEITRREFGLALRRIPEMGDDVVLAVLRSET